MIWVMSQMIRVKAGQSGQLSGRPDKFFYCRIKKTARNTVKITSDKKVFGIKVVLLVAAVDFHITIILIRVRMQKLQPD